MADVMVHRTKVFAVDLGQDALRGSCARCWHAPYTRVPVWRGKPDNIVGVIHAKDLLRRPRRRRQRRRPHRSEGDRPAGLVRAGPRPRSTTSCAPSAGARCTSPSSSTKYGVVRGDGDAGGHHRGDRRRHRRRARRRRLRRPPAGRRGRGRRRLGADPRPQPRHGLDPARRGARPPWPGLVIHEAQHDPRGRPDLHLPRLPIPSAAQASATASPRCASSRFRARRPNSTSGSRSGRERRSGRRAARLVPQDANETSLLLLDIDRNAWRASMRLRRGRSRVDTSPAWARCRKWPFSRKRRLCRRSRRPRRQ